MSCLVINGECYNTSYTYKKEPSDTLSDILRRCAKVIDFNRIVNKYDIAIEQGACRIICLEAGQSEEQAMLTYLAATQLSNSRRTT